MALVIMILLACGLVFTVGDFIINNGRIYSGVTIGGLDVAGMNKEEAAAAVQSQFADQLASTQVIVFANEDIASDPSIEEEIAREESLDELTSLEEARANRQLWVADANSLAAALDTDAMVEQALATGRGWEGPFVRLAALLGGWDVPVQALYDPSALESFAHEIDLTIGDPRVDYSISIEDGTASMIEGHDGHMVNRDHLADQLDEAFFPEGNGKNSFVAKVEFAPSRTTAEEVSRAVDALNLALSRPVVVNYNGNSYNVPRDELASWIVVSIDENKEGSALALGIDATKASPDLISMIHQAITGNNVSVRFAVDGGQVKVLTDGSVSIPNLDEALSFLDADLLNSVRAALEGKTQESQSSGITLTIENVTAPSSMSFDDALACGLITEISSFTTEYLNTSATQNRIHNIHLAADALNNSVIAANGGTWSFNEVVGDANESRGYLGAGTIQGNEHEDAIGGGICQVATTVFNAVFDAGYPIVRRNNHTLYIASYPDGRDAAVAYPDMDLIWRNDSNSDVLVRSSYTDTTLTIRLFGIDPGYVVNWSRTDWEKGAAFTTRYEVDENLAPGTQYTKTPGVNGMKITVYRTVTAPDGTILLEDVFYSTYQPETEVIVKGPDNPSAQASGDTSGDSTDSQ